jgi:hypothetical protein
MEKIKKEGLEKKTLYLFCAVSFAALYALQALILEPIYAGVAADVMSSPILAELLYYLCVAVEFLAVCIGYAVAIFGVFKFGARSFKGFIGIFSAAAFAKYLCKTAVNWSYTGAIPRLWYMDIIDVVYFTALEVLQLLIVWAVISKICNGTRRQDRAEFEFFKLFDRANPLMRASLWTAVISFVVRLLLQIGNDVMTILMYGAPEKIETSVLMVVSYVSTIIFGLFCYLVIVFTLSKLQAKDITEN